MISGRVGGRWVGGWAVHCGGLLVGGVCQQNPAKACLLFLLRYRRPGVVQV